MVGVMLAVAVLAGAGCQAIPLPCDIALVALPPDSTLESGDPLPGNLQILAGPDDFDRSATTIQADVNGNAAVDLTLRGDAIARVAAHTAGHIGEPMAIAINGTVAAVPFIQSQLPDGRIQISSGALDGGDLGEQFAGCVR